MLLHTRVHSLSHHQCACVCACVQTSAWCVCQMDAASFFLMTGSLCRGSNVKFTWNLCETKASQKPLFAAEGGIFSPTTASTGPRCARPVTAGPMIGSRPVWVGHFGACAECVTLLPHVLIPLFHVLFWLTSFWDGLVRTQPPTHYLCSLAARICSCLWLTQFFKAHREEVSSYNCRNFLLFS